MGREAAGVRGVKLADEQRVNALIVAEPGYILTASENGFGKLTPLEELVEQVAAGTLRVQVGKISRLDDIVEAHRCMEENKAGGKIVVLT